MGRQLTGSESVEEGLVALWDRQRNSVFLLGLGLYSKRDTALYGNVYSLPRRAAHGRSELLWELRVSDTR